MWEFSMGIGEDMTCQPFALRAPIRTRWMSKIFRNVAVSQANMLRGVCDTGPAIQRARTIADDGDHGDVDEEVDDGISWPVDELIGC